MKLIILCAFALTMTGCSTMGHIMQGMGNGLAQNSHPKPKYNCTTMDGGLSYTCN